MIRFIAYKARLYPYSNHCGGKATQEETMQTQTILKFTGAALFSLLISACGGGGKSTLDEIQPPSSSKKSSSLSSSSSSNTSSAATTSSSAGSTAPVSSGAAVSSADASPRKIGNGFDDTFTEGVIAVGIGSGSLAYGGSTLLTVSVVSNSNALVTTPIVVTFDSRCLDAGEATFTNSNNEAVTSVTTNNGQASVTYRASTCTGEDDIQATASLSGTVKMAEATIDVEPDTVQTISFVDAVPTRISLKGTGGIETSVVKFKLTGGSGTPLKNSQVTMTLNTTLGGLCLADPVNNSTCVSSVTGTTNASGEVSVTVQAGSIPTPIRITATALNTSISTQSNELLVSTGIPDQDSMSISASLLNPECLEVDGVKSTITMRMADAFNNPPPTGTAISFWAEGGKIDSGCSTNANGECSVTWTCQEPRPADGRVTILGFAQGNESFTDLDGDGYYDTADGFPTNYDYAEAFLDINEDGLRDSTTEAFVDFNQDHSFTAKNGIYNGVLCKTEGPACTKSGITVRASQVVVMSSRTLVLDITETTVAPATTRRFSVTLSDVNGNSAPNGTVLTINTAGLSNGSATIVGGIKVGNTTGPTQFTITVTPSGGGTPSGSVAVIATTPEGYAKDESLDL